MKLVDVRTKNGKHTKKFVENEKRVVDHTSDLNLKQQGSPYFVGVNGCIDFPAMISFKLLT